ncbi:putative holin-like toxin [Evansella vedderi]|uniref:putative holin-like toxin n=1 Tax=Evansella vedderi TaxID=38282 RepID=UPI003521DBC1
MQQLHKAGWRQNSLGKGGDALTIYESLSLIALFGQVLIALLVLVVTIVVFLNKKK